MEKFWLEGGQTTFWFQTLYSWIAGALLRSRRWWSRASKPVAFGMMLCSAPGLVLVARQTYHYPAEFNPAFGTQAGHLGLLKPGDSIANDLRNLGGSVMMILTRNDQP